MYEFRSNIFFLLVATIIINFHHKVNFIFDVIEYQPLIFCFLNGSHCCNDFFLIVSPVNFIDTNWLLQMTVKYLRVIWDLYATIVLILHTYYVPGHV